MNGGKNKQPLGYTIVELLIVLAVSGLMFVIAATFISGKQARTAFTTGSNEFASQLQSVMSDVESGQYSDVNFGCTATATTISISSSAQTQGTNNECVYLGKVIKFHNNSSKYEIYSLAAARVAASPDIVTAIKSGGAPPVDLTSYRNIPQSLEVKSLKVSDDSGSVSAATVGFAQSLDTSDKNVKSGTQTVDLVYTTIDPGAGIISPVKIAKSAIVCISDGARYAEITFGGSATNASQLSVNRKVVNVCT